MTELIPPYGGTLVDLLPAQDERADLLAEARQLPSLQLTDRAAHDLELMAVGAFSPLDRYMGEADYLSVLHRQRLSDGRLWPMPITLTAPEECRGWLGRRIALRSARNEPLATMDVQEVFAWSREEEAQRVAGTRDPRHPLVAEMSSWGPVCVSGPLRVLELPRAYDFAELRLTPRQTREALSALGFRNVVAFQTRNPMHRSHEELSKRAADRCAGALLIHPAVGLTRPGDVDHCTRVRTYKALVEAHYDPRRTLLALLPLAMRMVGPREALWHAIIRRNYGASHFIVGRDHAGPGLDSSGRPFYGPDDAQRLVRAHAAEIGVGIVSFSEMVYLPEEDRYEERDRVPEGRTTLSLSGTQVREDYLRRGRPLPAWFSRPETAAILAKTSPPWHELGFCVWFTGLSAAGKSATAEALTALLLEHGRQVTVLDGDVVRTHLSQGLGFSRQDRDTNIRRIGFVASEIVRHGGAVVVAAVSPYRDARNQCRGMMAAGRFVEVFMDTPFDVCRRRDTKGLYEKALRGELEGFTGVDDPYEAPSAPELLLTTTDHGIEENARAVLDALRQRGFLRR